MSISTKPQTHRNPQLNVVSSFLMVCIHRKENTQCANRDTTQKQAQKC